ncbi:MAG: DUF4040 domain-containing protein [Clostridiales bacterium]|nr:DUF4040 domain-containing protein [Candidatus Crickella equi]
MLLLQALLLMGLIAITISIIFGKNILITVIVYNAFSFITMFLYIVMGAPDVAFTEAVIGVISTVYFLMILKNVYRKSK